MADEVVVGLFTLGGVVVGFLGQWTLERWREKKMGHAAVSAVFYEMSLLAAALESAVKDQERTRKEIKALMWERYAPELINYLPGPFVTVLQLHYDQLDKVAYAYAKGIRGDDEAEWREISALMLGWAYRADRLRELLSEWWRKRLPIWKRRMIQCSADAASVWEKIRSTSDIRSQTEVIRLDVESYANQRLHAEGHKAVHRDTSMEPER